MMYLYQTLPDETEIVHSHLIIEDGVQKESFILNALPRMALTLPVVPYQSILGFLSMATLLMKSRFFEQFLHENEQELYELACKKPHKKEKRENDERRNL